MPTRDQLRKAVVRIVFGAPDLHQQCAVGLPDPQTEIGVWFNGTGVRQDVTYSHVMAAAQPLTLGVGLGPGCDSVAIRKGSSSLEFRERNGDKRLLGRINLQWHDEVPLGEECLQLFRVRSCRNYCLPRGRIWAHYSYYAYRRWRERKRQAAPGLRMVVRELHSVFVFYICPRPVVLVSVCEGNLANIFPMDLIGQVDPTHFALALHNSSMAVPLLERSGHIALSSIPVEQAPLAYALGKNHKRTTVNWAEIPLATTLSTRFAIPVPQFALRVREMQIESVRPLGSHNLYLAKSVLDAHWAEGMQMFLVHGIYQARRLQRQDHGNYMRRG